MTPIRPLPRLLIAAVVLSALPLFAQSGFIAGTVRSESGAPLAGMVVAAYNTAGEPATTNVSGSDGTYLLSLAPATYRVLAYDSQGTWATSYYNEAGSFETSAEIPVGPGTARSGIDFRLRPGIKIHGSVLSAGGAPLSNMTVSAYNLDGTRRGYQTSGGTGDYVLVVPAGQYKIAAWDDRLVYAPEFYANARSFTSAATVSATGATFGIDFSLDVGARASGSVVSARTGQPLPGIEIAAYDATGGERVAHAITRAGGDFLFTLPAGRYKFSASDPSGTYALEFFSSARSFEAAASFELGAGSWKDAINFKLLEREGPLPVATLFIPAIINLAGAEGSYWRTDVWIYNPGQETLSITATYVSGTTGTLQAAITVSPRGQVEISNIVQSLFGSSGLGSLRLQASKTFAANSRTFNTPANASVAGTFGFSIAAMDTGATLGLAVLPGVAQSAAYRTNIGIMNPHDYPITVRARLYSASGDLLGDASVPLTPLAVQQPALINLFGGVQVTEGYVVLSSADGSFFSYASVVDNKSNDPTLVLPSADHP